MDRCALCVAVEKFFNPLWRTPIEKEAGSCNPIEGGINNSNLQPYRTPQYQKTDIKKLGNEMLEDGMES